MLNLFFSLVVIVFVYIVINKKFNQLNKKINDLQDELQRVLEQVDNQKQQALNKKAELASEQHTKQVVKQTAKPEEYIIVDKAEQIFNKSDQSQKAINHSSVTPSTKNNASEPDEQSIPIVTSVMQSLKNWFFGGNLVVRVGAIVLLMGIILLLRLLSEYFETPIELKLMAVGGIGLAIAGLGLKLVKKRFTYAITLQGAGLAIAYLTAFFAYQVYAVLPSLPSFVLLGSLSAITILLAVRQNAFPLALLAFSGGFLAPLLTSNNTGSLTTLFGYYLLLNVAIAVIANYRTWKVLNLLAATVTFGFAYYLGFIDSLTTIEDFKAQRWPLVAIVTLHWLLYVFVVIRYTQQILRYNDKIAHDHYIVDIDPIADTPIKPSSRFSTYKDSNTAFIIPVDVSLMFGVPLLAFGLLSFLIEDINHALTLASALMSATYLALGAFFVKKDQAANNNNQTRYRPLIEGMLALGFGFFALMISLALDAEWTACGWSIQGLALVWFGRQSLRGWTVLFGLLLQALAVASLLSVYSYYNAPSPSTLSLCISAISCIVSIFILRRENTPTLPINLKTPAATSLLASINNNNPVFKMLWINPIFVSLLSLVAMVWGLVVTGMILGDKFGYLFKVGSDLIACSLLINLIVYLIVDYYRQWNEVRFLNHGVLFLFYLALLSTLVFNFEFHSFLKDGYLHAYFWPVFISLIIGWLVVAQLWLKRWSQTNQSTSYDAAGWLLTGTLIIAFLSYYLLPRSEGIVPVLITATWLISLTYLSMSNKLKYPNWFNWRSALLGCAFLSVPVSVVWAIYSNWYYEGTVWGLTYLPVLNLYDICLFAILAYLIGTHHLSAASRHKFFEDLNILLKVAGLLGFWILSSLLVRTLHAYIETPLWSQGAWYSDKVQTSLTILWTLTALIATFISSRNGKRFWWFMGISLLGMVVLKLVLVDLSQTDAIWRVVSFLGAGSLILLIGYLAPLPPEEAAG